MSAMNPIKGMALERQTPESDSQALRLVRVRSSMKRSQFIDKLGRWAITISGVLVLACVGSILVFLLTEAAPLVLQSEKHPQGTIDKMFAPQLYSGYQKPQWMWQTEASEGGQEKYGVPLLIWGSLKGAFWAILFSVPLALLSALFVAEFASPRLRTWVKSCVELLAGVPTVMVGFFAFVVLSTALNHYYLEHQNYFTHGQWVLVFFQAPLFAFAASAAAARIAAQKWSLVSKTLAIGAAVIFCGALVMALGRACEALAGASLAPYFGVAQYTQLNGILAGFCLGFAVIPIVFSVAEDAMKAVPHAYREASLALGGSKWETALRVVVPAALPGIYAALMLGLARALGETMIVLMASGNTPILDPSPFTGMRTMAAAIAIETSEKARFSTGYHVLFFVGATLFAMTFVMNSLTQWVINRLKSRYGSGE